MTARVAAAAMLLSACDRVYESAEEQCVRSDRAAENAAIIECAAAANPKSDEEGEDLVAECARVMRDSLCLQREWFYTLHVNCPSCAPNVRVRCARATQKQQAVCRLHGWEP